MLGLPDGEKNFGDMYNRLGTIPACDRQTDGQTSCHGIVRVMHTRRAVKTGLSLIVRQLAMVSIPPPHILISLVFLVQNRMLTLNILG